MELNLFTIRGGKFSNKSVKQSTSAIQIDTVHSLYFSSFPLESLLLFILHLFLHFYPTCRQLRVYIDTYPISLLQKSLGDGYKAEKVLFRGHFLINAVIELATEYSMRQQQISLRYSQFSFSLNIQEARPCHWSFLKGHFNHQELYLIYVQLI